MEPQPPTRNETIVAGLVAVMIGGGLCGLSIASGDWVYAVGGLALGAFGVVLVAREVR